MGLDDFELEPSSAEPDEWDPEEDQHDPDADGITIPSVSTAESDAPADVARTFWIVTLIVNVAILFVSVGPMLLFFQGWTRRGLALIAAGLVLFWLAYRRYRAFTERAPDEDDGAPLADENAESTASAPQDEDASRTGPSSIDGATGPAETLSGSGHDPATQQDTETTRS